MENNLKEIKEFIAQWKVKAIDYYHQSIEECKKERKEIYEEIDSEKRIEKMREFKEKYTQIVRDLSYGYAQEDMEERLLKIINRDAETKEQLIIARVNKCVGKIEESLNLYVGVNGELNGKIKGENGICKIETIYAGGYNIQCLHYRVLVKKL